MLASMKAPAQYGTSRFPVGACRETMDERIRTRMDDTRRLLFEHLDEDVHQRLRVQLADAKAQLDRFGKRFWALTRFMLRDQARFDDNALASWGRASCLESCGCQNSFRLCRLLNGISMS